MRHVLRLLAISLLMADVADVANVAFAASPGPIEAVIQTDQAGARIDRNVFGQFAEHLGSGIYDGIWVGKESSIANVRGIRSDVVAALRRLHVPNVRWPGGCFADEYHWRDGVGPASMRKSTVNSNWGGAIESNAFGTDEFMDFIGQIGSEAYISLNVGSGTPAEAAAWMAYMTADARTSAGRERAANGHPTPYKVRFLGIGNESWGCGGSMSPDYYVSQLKLYTRFAHNLNPAQAGEHSMWRIAVGADGANTDYVEAVMRAWKERPWSWDMEGVSLHSYTSAGWPPKHPSTGFDESEYARLLSDTLHMDTLISRDTAIMDRYDPARKIALAVDEWGAWLAPLPGTNSGYLVQQNSLRDAILAALNLNIFARHADRVKMANIAQMINVLQAMIMTRGEKIVLTPTYHVFELYVPFQDATFLPVRFAPGVYSAGSATLPRVDAIAARDSQGRVWLAAINLDAHESVRLRLATSAGEARSAIGQVLTAARVDSVNTFEAPDVVKPVALSVQGTARGLEIPLPPKSVTVVEIK
jgi:alpha-L-arabinofuranosidase